MPDYGQTDPTPQNVFDNRDAYWWEGGKKVESGTEFNPRKLQTSLDKLTRKHTGRRSRTHTDRKRGHYVQARPAGDKTDDIAFDATLRAAAPFQKQRGDQLAKTGMAYALRKSDLQRKVRVRRTANLILFVVDASWSMAVSERMQATKGAIMSLLDRCLSAPGSCGVDCVPERPRQHDSAPHQLGHTGEEGAGEHPRRWQDTAYGGTAAGL